MARNGRVLVVEDEILIRMLATDMLDELGYGCDEAGSAAEAMSKLGNGAKYRLVFLDIGLPDRRGDDLVGDIRSRGDKLPLLIASGEDQADLKKRLGGYAPIGFLAKPYNSEALRAAIGKLVSESGA